MKKAKVKINTHGLLILKPTKDSMRDFTEEERAVCEKALLELWGKVRGESQKEEWFRLNH